MKKVIKRIWPPVDSWAGLWQLEALDCLLLPQWGSDSGLYPWESNVLLRSYEWHNWTQLRPWCKLLRSWQVVFYSSCGHPRQAWYKVPLIIKPDTYYMEFFSLSLPSVYGGQFSMGSSWGCKPTATNNRKNSKLKHGRVLILCTKVVLEQSKQDT